MSDAKVNINQADRHELAALPGIGLKVAAKIIEYRETKHPFTEVAELTAVPGISEQLIRKIGDRLTVGESGDIEEISASGMEVGGHDEQYPPPPVDEAAATIRESEDGETAPAADTGSEAIETAGAEVESEEEEIVITPEGDVLPESDTSDPTGTRPEIFEVEEAATEIDEVEAEPVVEPEPEPVMVIGPTTAELELEEERVAVTPTPAEPPIQTTILVGYILSTLAGALIGAVLVLLFLLLVNRTLHFAGDARTGDLQDQYDQEINSLTEGQVDLQNDNRALLNDLDNLDSQIETVTADQETHALSLIDLQADLPALEEELQTLSDSLTVISDTIAAVEEDLARLDERYNAITMSAENFDAFLNGMRDLLITLQGPSTIPTTATPATVSPSVTTTPTSPATARPTRTPRPTATPLSIPSPTSTP